jgi:hypothetical protein
MAGTGHLKNPSVVFLLFEMDEALNSKNHFLNQGFQSN